MKIDLWPLLQKLVGGLTVVLLLVMAPLAAVAGETIKIGVAGSHTGDLASYGIPSVRAAEMVVKEANARGGVLGKKIELVVADDACKPEIATNTATKLVSQGVVAVVGHICSGATKAALGIYKDAHVLVVSPSATNPELTNGQYPNFFRTIATDDSQARLIVDFAVNRLKLTKIAILHDKGDYGKGFAEYARRFILAGRQAQLVLFEGITPGAVDYSSVIQKIRRSGAQGVIFGGYHPEAASLVSQMRKRGVNIIFLSDDGVKDDTFIKVAGRYAEGVYASGPRDTRQNPLAIAAINAHKRTYGTAPGPFFLNAYAATQAILNGIAVARSTNPDAVQKAMRTSFVKTPLGSISFDQRGEAIGVGFSMYQVRGGTFVQLN